MIRVEHIMGTAIGIDLRDIETAGAIDDVFVALREIDARFSTYRPDSEISRISRRELRVADASDDVRRVLRTCEEIEIRTGGVFDVWSHRSDGGLDPSALVKGWALERGAQILEQAGARNFCINGGGDVIAMGEPAPGRAWRVGIRHPEIGHRFAAVIGVRDLAVATSGAYERGEHIVDARTKDPARAWLSMTVTGPRMGLADAYSTAAFAMGEEGISWVASLAGYEAFAITADRRAILTVGFDALRADQIEVSATG